MLQIYWKEPCADIKGKPIELATVSLNNVIGSHTDRNGHYKLTRLKEGTYQYRVSFVVMKR